MFPILHSILRTDPTSMKNYSLKMFFNTTYIFTMGQTPLISLMCSDSEYHGIFYTFDLHISVHGSKLILSSLPFEQYKQLPLQQMGFTIENPKGKRK